MNCDLLSVVILVMSLLLRSNALSVAPTVIATDWIFWGGRPKFSPLWRAGYALLQDDDDQEHGESDGR